MPRATANFRVNVSAASAPSESRNGPAGPVCDNEGEDLVGKRCPVAPPPSAPSSLPSPSPFPLALVAGRCLYSASIFLSMFAGPEMLLKACRDDHARTARISAAVGTMGTLLNFGVGPIAGGLMDAHGRKPFLVFGALAGAITKFAFSRRPSVRMYLLYRLVVGTAIFPFFSSFWSAVSDLSDRTSPQYTAVKQNIESALTAVRILTLAAAARSSMSPRSSMRASAAMAACSACCFAFGMSETLHATAAVPVQWKSVGNPLNSLAFFRRTPSLRKLGLLSMLLSLPAYNNTAMQLRKQRFGWRMEDHARQSFRFQICALLSPITTRHNMAFLGLTGSAKFGQWLGALGNALDVLAPNGGWLAMIPLLSSLRQDTDAFDQALAIEAKDQGIGEGAIRAAVNNLDMVPGLVVPNIFSEMYARLGPHSVCVLCSSIQVANAQIFIPLLWPKTAAQEPP